MCRCHHPGYARPLRKTRPELRDDAEGLLIRPIKSGGGRCCLVSISAATIRELLRELIEQYPGMQNQLDDGIAVSVNGQIFRDKWSEEIPEGAEVFLLPRIQGG